MSSIVSMGLRTAAVAVFAAALHLVPECRADVLRVQDGSGGSVADGSDQSESPHHVPCARNAAEDDANANACHSLAQAEFEMLALQAGIADQVEDPEAFATDQSSWRSERNAGCAGNAGDDEANEIACRIHHTVERIAEFEAALGVENGNASPASP